MSSTLACYAKKIILVLALVAAAAGCSKKTPPPAAATTPIDTVSPATAATPAPIARPAVNVADVTKTFAEADAALKARAYDKAAQALIAVQAQKQLSDQQAQEVRNRMISLQQNLAAAMANGDANAKAAADMIRRSHMVH